MPLSSCPCSSIASDSDSLIQQRFNKGRCSQASLYEREAIARRAECAWPQINNSRTCSGCGADSFRDLPVLNLLKPGIAMLGYTNGLPVESAHISTCQESQRCLDAMPRAHDGFLFGACSCAFELAWTASPTYPVSALVLHLQSVQRYYSTQ